MGSLVGAVALSVLLSAVAAAADPPSVSEFSVAGSPSPSGSLAFTLSFSADVSGLDASDITTDGTATGCVVGQPTGGPQGYSIAVSGCSEGTLALLLAADSVALAGEPTVTGPATQVASDAGTIDLTPPQVHSFSVLSATPVSGSTIDYQLTFSEPVTGLVAGSFRVFPESGQPWSVSAITGSGDGYTVTLGRTTSTSGTVTLRLRRDAVSDLAGNVGPPLFVEAPAVSYTTPGAATVSLSINGGASSTADPTLKLSLAAGGFGSGLQMRFSLNGGTSWTAYEAFAASRDLALPAKHRWGTVTVNAELKDGAGATASTSQSILYGQAQRSTMALAPSYLIKATLNYSTGRITAQQTVDLANASNQVIGWLDFSVFARQYDKLTVSGVTVDGAGATPAYTNKANMRVPLGFNLRPGESTRVVVSFVATATSNVTDYQRSRLAKADGVMQVSSWHPLLSDGHPVRLPGDGQFSVAADYRFELTHPSGVVIAAPGTLVSSSATTKVYRLANAREYAWAASPNFAISEATTAQGVKVLVYHIPGTSGVAAGRNAAVKALQAHSNALGAYPYNRLVIAQGSRTSVALEYSGMIFMGKSVIGSAITIAHEVAHQWWYGIVGNDQLGDPWLDEAFSEFSSRHLGGWSMPGHCSTRPVSSSIYDFANKMTYGCNSYGDAIYNRGAVFINGIRLRLGNGPFMNALRTIVAENRYRIVTTAKVREVFLRYTSNKAGLNSYMDGFLKGAPSGGTDPGLAPQASVPARALFAPQALGSTVLLRVSWTPASGPQPIASYELQRKKGSGAWAKVTLPSKTATSVDAAVAPDAKYEFRLRAIDTAGNTSTWAKTTAAKARLIQEAATSISWTGSWTRAALSGASGGYVRHAAAAGSLARFAFSGASVAFVSTRGPGRGIAEVWLDGKKVDTIDLYASSVQKAQVVWAASFAYGTHNVEVRVTGAKRAASSGPRVDVDAFLVHP